MLTQAEALALREKYGSWAEASRQSGIPRSTIREAAERTDPAIREAMSAVGTGMVPSMAWIKTKATKEAPGYSVMLKPQECPDDFLERIKAAFEGMEPAPVVPEPVQVNEDELTAYLLSDRHAGLMAWARETGEAYDTNIAAHRVKEWVARAVSASPPRIQP